MFFESTPLISLFATLPDLRRGGMGPVSLPVGPRSRPGFRRAGLDFAMAVVCAGLFLTQGSHAQSPQAQGSQMPGSSAGADAKSGAVGAGPASSGLLAAKTEGVTLRLKNGKFLVAELLDAGEEGIRVRRLDNGGEIQLRWNDLMVGDANRIKAQNSLLGNATTGEVMIRAVRAQFQNKTGARQTVEGEMVESSKDKLILQKKGNRFIIPRNKLLGAPQEIELPITDILRKDEIYQRKLEEISPDDDADKHVLLASYLIRVDLLDKAREHLIKAQELGSSSQPSKIKGLLKRVDTLIANKEQASLLAEISIAKNRKHFAKALELCDRF